MRLPLGFTDSVSVDFLQALLHHPPHTPRKTPVRPQVEPIRIDPGMFCKSEVLGQLYKQSW